MVDFLFQVLACMFVLFILIGIMSGIGSFMMFVVSIAAGMVELTVLGIKGLFNMIRKYPIETSAVVFGGLLFAFITYVLVTQ